MEQEDENLLLKYVAGVIPFSQWLESENLDDLDSDSEDEEEENESGRRVLSTIDAEAYSEEFIGDVQFEARPGGSSTREDDTPLPVVTPVTLARSTTHTSSSHADLEGAVSGSADEGDSQGGAEALEMLNKELESKKRKTKKRRRRKCDLPEMFRSHMGEANLCVARGDIAKAKDICMEIIRQAPYCKEPFQTLGHIYEDNDDPERALQLYLISAHLGPGDVDEWMKLAELSLEQGNVQQAIMCYHKASKVDRTNLLILWTKAQLHEQEGETKKAMDTYEAALKIMPDEDGEKYFTIATSMAKNYHENGEVEKAVEVMEGACDKHPQFISSEAVNMLGDLYIAMRTFEKALDFICSTCGITRELLSQPTTTSSSLGDFVRLAVEDNYEGSQDPGSSEKEMVEKWNVPPDLPIDLRSKIIVCLIQLHKFTLIQEIITPMLHESPEECGDLYLDIAEAYAENGCFEQALPILNMLVNTKRFDQAVVWLKRAECLSSLGNYEESARSYSKVVTLAPHHLQARLTLAALYQQLGQPDEALEVLTQNLESTEMATEEEAPDESPTPSTSTETRKSTPQKQMKPATIPDLSQEDLQLIYHRCSLLYSQNRYTEFVKNGLQLLSYYFRDTFCKKPEDLDDLAIAKQKRTRVRKLKEGAEEQGEEQAVPASVIDEVCDALREEEWWDLFKKVTFSLGNLKQFKDAEHIIKAAISSSKFCETAEYEKEMYIMCCTCGYLSGNISLAYEIARMLIADNLGHTALWNLFNRILTKMRDTRHHRFCMRLMHKYPDCLPLMIVNGNSAFVTGTYKYALSEYNRAFRLMPDDPFIMLYTGVVYVHLASQKFPQRRHSHMIEAFVFLFQYMALRGKCQEAYYNIGRAFHQVGLFHFAVHYYNKALQFPYDNPTEGLKVLSGKQVKPSTVRKYGLHREAAFNLSLIYRESGNEALARQLLAKYCRV